jgi:hypothetical protein
MQSVQLFNVGERVGQIFLARFDFDLREGEFLLHLSDADDSFRRIYLGDLFTVVNRADNQRLVGILEAKRIENEFKLKYLGLWEILIRHLESLRHCQD